MAHIYIDFENVNAIANLDGIDELGANDHIHIMYTSASNCQKIGFEMFLQAIRSSCTIDAELCSNGHKDALDFQIMGTIAGEYTRRGKYYIISKDKGFDYFIEPFCRKKLADNIQRFNSIMELLESRARKGNNEVELLSPQPKIEEMTLFDEAESDNVNASNETIDLAVGIKELLDNCIDDKQIKCIQHLMISSGTKAELYSKLLQKFKENGRKIYLLIRANSDKLYSLIKSHPHDEAIPYFRAYFYLNITPEQAAEIAVQFKNSTTKKEFLQELKVLFEGNNDEDIAVKIAEFYEDLKKIEQAWIMSHNENTPY